MDLEKRLELARLFDFYGPLLTHRQQEVFDLYYLQDYSLAEIAQSAGITRQAVHDLLQRSGRQLELFEKRLGLVRRFHKQEADLRSLVDDLLEIKNAMDERPDCRQLADRLGAMIKSLESIGET